MLPVLAHLEWTTQSAAYLVQLPGFTAVNQEVLRAQAFWVLQSGGERYFTHLPHFVLNLPIQWSQVHGRVRQTEKPGEGKWKQRLQRTEGGKCNVLFTPLCCPFSDLALHKNCISSVLPVHALSTSCTWLFTKSTYAAACHLQRLIPYIK